MAKTRTQLYMPVSDAEIADGRGYTSRIAGDFKRQINNLKSHACASMLIPNNTLWNNSSNLTSTRTIVAGHLVDGYMLRWAPVPFPLHYTQVRVVICGYVTAGTWTFKFWADRSLAKGANPLDATAFTSDAKSTTVALTSATYEVQGGTISGIDFGAGVLDSASPYERLLYLTMTASTSGGLPSTLHLANVAAWALPTVDPT